MTERSRFIFKRLIKNSVFFILILLVLSIFLFIFFWMLMGSFKTQVENTASPPVFISSSPTLENYKAVFMGTPFLRYMVNSFIVAGFSTVIGLVFGIPAAYSIARYRQKKLSLSILLIRMTPGIAYCVPLYILYTKLGLVDSYLALISTHLILTLPFIIWLMIGYFEELPNELEDSAMIDGCTRAGYFFYIALPLVRAGVAVATTLTFIDSWNYFMFSLVLSTSRTKLLPVAVYNFISYEEINWGGLYSAATVIVLPVLILVLFIQKHVIKGLTFGAVKG